ncbi:protein Wiz isoform X2 [Spea bombifrons]|uniref:protein Wiz isoform X2 n=1 Tax=Spea bombifrons TaxID=233779 RepID=UPI00234BA676|nr:protein Wiz isoform X2 [Spea bombifrons]
MRRHLPMEPDEVAGGVIGRSEEDHHTSMLATSKFSLPPADFKTLHQIGSRPSSWSYSVTDAQEEDERRADGMSSDGEYMQTGRFEWTSSVEGSEGHSQLMMVRSDPPAITMPVFRRALQLGSVQEAWQSGNYSGEEAQVEVEEEDDDEDDEEGSVYTCIECSIYFKKKAHLLEHMFQHTQEGEREGTQTGDGPHTCGECGKYFGDESSLTSHRQLHQESRQKIMEEIRKLESLADEGRGARLQCPKCLFGTNSSKVFVQHAKTHVKKGSGENRTTSTSLRMPADTVMGSSAEEGNDGAWKNSETETESEQEWGMEVSRAVMVGGLQGPSKVKMKTPPRAGTGICAKGEQQRVGGSQKTSLVLPETAVQLKKKFQEALKVGGEGEEGQRRQLREEVAVVVLENLSYKKKSPKESQALGYDKRTFGSSGGLSSQSFTSASELHLPREEWPEDGEGDLPLDILLMDPTYEGQLEALGLRSEERECPYCPDRFHNGIGLANHVRGHLNRVGVSYNVRHFISAEEVKAIEQNYSIQKKRKKVANFDPSTFSLMRCEFCGAGFDTRAGLSSHARAHLRDFGITNWELTVSPIHVLARLLARSPGRPLPPFPAWHQDTDTDVLLDESEKPAKERVTVPSNMQHLAVLGSDEEEDIRPLDLGMSQNPKLDTGRTEKMPSDQSTSRAEDPKGPGQTTCEVCGACFETRKGLSSHARSHLRHLGVAESESSGAPIDLLYELAKQGKLPQDESFLGAKKTGSPMPGSPRGQWGDEDGPLNLTLEGEPGRETDCQFCGAWFETRKGLSSHARAHLRHLGVTDPDAKGSPIAALNSLIKSEDFKRRLSTHSQEMAEGKGGDQASKVSDAGAHSMPEDNGEPKETSVHFKSPGGVGSSTQVKIVEAGVSHAMSSEGAAHSKLAEAGSSMVKTEAGRPPSKLSETGTHHKTSLSGLSHTRLPPPSGTPPAKKLKTTSPACKSNMDSFWTTNNSSTPLNLSPGSEEVRCEFCGEFFENRKGLSSHARSHLRQMGVTEWHVNGSPIDTLREILASGTYPRAGTRVGGPNLEKRHPHPPPSSPSRPMPYSGLASSMQRKPPRLPTFHEWPSDLSPLNLSSRADPARDIRCEFCNEFFENRKGLSSHARSHLRQMGVTEWHVNGSPIDTLREIIRKRHLQSPQLSNIKKEPRGNDEPTGSSHLHSTHGMGSLGVSALGRAHNAFLSPMPTKRPASHEPRLTQSEPKTYVRVEPKPSTHSQAKAYVQGEARHKSYMQDENRHKAFIQGEGRPKSYVQGDPRPKTYIQSDGRPKTYIHGDSRPKPYGQGETKHKPYSQSDGRLKQYMHGDNKPKGYGQGDGKPKAYIQTELPFKVKVKPSPDKPPTTLEACCELCGLYFENRKALASHARAHLRQFGVTEWCVNGSPIETLREWMKQRPQKAGAYLSYIQGGRPFAKKFKRSSQIPKAAAAEKDSAAATSAKVAEADRVLGASGPVVDKLEGQGQKAERRQSKLPEIPPSREDSLTDSLPKSEEPKPAPRPRPVPSLVPRPPQTSLVKFVGNIYTLKCRFCDIQFQGPLSIQEQWVRHLQHHILEMNFSKPPSSPTLASPPQSEPAKA